MFWNEEPGERAVRHLVCHPAGVGGACEEREEGARGHPGLRPMPREGEPAAPAAC